MTRTKHKRRKREANDLKRFDNLPTFLEQEGRRFYSNNKITKGYKDDPKIHLEKLHTWL